MQPSSVGDRADFSIIRYAQCWEDTDILLTALDLQPGDRCLSIASAGDNTLALLSKMPAQVVAIDLSPAQLACLELRVAAYRELDHGELLTLIGSKPGSQRQQLYQRCRSQLSPDGRHFWDSHGDDIDRGIGNAGKFERYFALFRQRVLPLVHNRQQVDRLLAGGTLEQRQEFYDRVWNSWQWRALFRLFFSRFVMGRMGRDPSFFQYVEGRVSDPILHRTHYALTQLNPADNPYLQWILTGQHRTALPYALRPENFDAIRQNLDRLEVYCGDLESYLDRLEPHSIHRFNLSDIFEYLSLDQYHHLLKRLIHVGHPGGRLAYWNMLAPRCRPAFLQEEVRSLVDLSHSLHQQDKAFFYSAFVVEELV